MGSDLSGRFTKDEVGMVIIYERNVLNDTREVMVMRMTSMTGMAMENKDIDGLRDISKVEMKITSVKIKRRRGLEEGAGGVTGERLAWRLFELHLF